MILIWNKETLLYEARWCLIRGLGMAEFYDDGQIFESKVGHDTDKYSKQSPDKSDDCLVAFG